MGGLCLSNMYWFIFCKDEIILTSKGQIPRGNTPPLHLEDCNNSCHRLSMLYGEKCIAVEISSLGDNLDGFRQIGLRDAYEILSTQEYRMAGKAREILYWDCTTKYCGICGSPMQKNSDISKKCTQCGNKIWPSLAIAIIVLVRKYTEGNEQVLLVRARNFRGNYHGLVAGFVETGENLEECLEREVMEETGLKVKNIRYCASQAWPYPSGLMVGYMADYEDGDIQLQTSELCAGGWFSKDNLPEIPGKVSLARRLIDLWLEEK